MLFFANFKKKKKKLIFFWIFTLCSLHFQVFHPQEIWRVLQEQHRYHLSNNHSPTILQYVSKVDGHHWYQHLESIHGAIWHVRMWKEEKICFNLNAKFPGPHLFSLALPCLVLLRNLCGLGLRCLYF